MTVSILRLEDLYKKNLRESDLVKARRSLEASSTLNAVVPGIDKPPGTKCVHGVYLPYGEKVALYCSECNPYILEIPEELQKHLNPVENTEEASLLQAVEDGQLSEAVALRRLGNHRAEAKVEYDINKAYDLYNSGQLDEGQFWQSLLRFVKATAKHRSTDFSTFSNIEDAINETTLQIWQRLKDFDASRSSFKTFATVVTLTQIRRILRQYRADRGGMEHIQLDEEQVASKALSGEQRLLFREWLEGLDTTDRRIVEMLRDGLTQIEIGEALSISQPAVAKRLSRLRREEKSPFKL